MKCAGKGCSRHARGNFYLVLSTSDAGSATKLSYCTKKHMRAALKELVG